MQDKLPKAGQVGGGNSNVGAGSGDIDPSWFRTSGAKPGI